MNRRRIPEGFPWVLPSLLVLLALSIYPLIYSVKLAAADRGNFTRLFTDRLFLTASIQTIVLTIAALAIEFFLGLALALLVDSLARGRMFFRTALLIPMLLPPVVAAVAWRLIYNPQFGVLNGTLRWLGFHTAHLTWTSGESSALASVILVDVWEWTPFLFLLLSAGLQAIPPEPLEAARVDGAGAWRIFRDVTLPLLKPTIVLALLLRAMDLVRIFDQIFILTQGGPGTATETVSLYIYRTAFRFSNFGYAAAMSFVLLAATMLFSRGLLRAMRAR
ncbi:MAG TPA: sugar ABC transporter permease [Bryobacteraceae bacterium]|jgi:multiple sugar transport system permease protein|nr:sugar ABC transporter permease [Bryobacteraceae bacterium]